MTELFGLTLPELAKEMTARGEKPYRARQIYGWLYNKRVTSFEEMSDIRKSFRQELAENYALSLPKIIIDQRSKDGTIKLLLELSDGGRIETALLPYDYGNAVCVTSELGCNMGCAFCASGLLKRKRVLQTHELVGQVMVMDELLRKEGRSVSHVVVMGTGEPFDNYEHVMDFIRIINAPQAFAIGARHITVSTCGLPSCIRRYGTEGLQTNLAISLHAPNDELRDRLMPINKAHPLKEVLAAVKDYVRTSGRRVTFEYILLQGINDTPEDARELARLIKGIPAFINLIPYNPIEGLPFKRSKNVHAFFDLLMKLGVMVTIRKEFGTDILAACGQLRAREALT